MLCNRKLPVILTLFLLVAISNACAARPAGTATLSITQAQTPAFTVSLQETEISMESAALTPTLTNVALFETATPAPSPAQASPTLLPLTPAVTPTLEPRAWRLAPVIPTSVSTRMLEVYQLGQSLGNDPHALSVVGDCQSMQPDFLGDFDNGKYNLGEYTYLQPLVDYFSGSYGRYSRAAKIGLTASGVMATLWNSWKDCNVQETPLECEYRIHKPSFAIISLGTNDANGILPFEGTLRKVIEVTLEHGIVPILATKADNAEGDWSINATIFRLAYQYQIPVWNFWMAVQPLPEKGLRSPEHLTYGEYTLSGDFSTPENMQYAYNVRNLTAMQVLDVVWRSVTGQTASQFIPTPASYQP